MLTAQLAVGTVLFHDDATWTVVEFAGRRLLLRRRGGREVRQVDAGWLLAHPTTRFSQQEPRDYPPPVSAVFAGLTQAQQNIVRARTEHVQELLTGFRHGDESVALPGEPRPSYGQRVSRMDRYRAKAAELGVGLSTVRRWVAAFERHGPHGLLPAAERERAGPLGQADPRWVAACRDVLAAHVEGSRPTRALVLAQTQAKLEEDFGPGVVPVPAATRGYELLNILAKGTNSFTGSTKGKRSIASRPAGVYGRLHATRPGEYVLLDTNRLDVYAMDQLTCRWVQTELSVAMDLYSRCILGLRLTPISTKAIDIAGVLYETLCPPASSEPDQTLPAAGIPAALVFDPARLAGHDGKPLLPSAAAETLIFDHGQIYLSAHLRSVCARFGISLQPARPYTATDKSPLERWFRTLNEGLLVALPGYKGSDVYSRGRDAEEQAFFFLSELESIIRQWIAGCYHQRPHAGLCTPEVPGLELSPLEMFEHGVNRAGYLTVLDRPDLAYDFLQTAWANVHHYGVQVNGLRYDAPVLVKYRNQPSPFTGVHAGKWPFAYDRSDITRLFFHDPQERTWHTVWWEHAAAFGQPLSDEALSYARRLAAARYRFPDTKHALAELLQRWGAGLTETAAERRIALRLSESRSHLVHHPESAGDDSIIAAENADSDAEPADRVGTDEDSGAFYADVMDTE